MKTLSKLCDFNTLEDRLITMIIIIGVKDKGLKENLLREEEISMNEAEKICRAHEASRQQIKLLEKSEEVHAIKKAHTANQQSKTEQVHQKCSYCGQAHVKGNCPAFGKKVCIVYKV